MGIFSRKTCADFLSEIRRHLEVIAAYPRQTPSLGAEKEMMLAAQMRAHRALYLLKKVDALDRKSADALRGKLYIIETAEKYSALQPNAASALLLIEHLESECEAKLARKSVVPMKRGRMLTYGRMMGIEEYRRLVAVKCLESSDTREMIPAFKAPKSIIDDFLKMDKTAIHNIYALIGGTGNVGYVVFFKTNVVPVDIGPPRRWPRIFEVKFSHGTPIEIIGVRRV
jgi:hypothetical protein